jgi:hypothetical protein
MLVQLGIVVSAIVAIVPSVNAQSIANGDYQSVYQGSYAIQVRNNKFTVVYDDPTPSEPWTSISNAGFKSIKTGVFYDPRHRTYYCLFNYNNRNTAELNRKINQSKKMKKNIVCSPNGWKLSNSPNQ